MSLHIHRNSFNAGELSPLMDARVDDAKHPFSCRILENFLPKVYGGAFRRPGSLYLGTAHDLAVWAKNTNDHNIQFADDETPGVNDDETFYQVGSLWLTNVRTVYGTSDVSSGAASWSEDTKQHNLFSFEAPGASNDTTESYVVGSLWFNQGTDTLYKATDVTAGAAVWAKVTAKVNLTATAAPTVNDDTGDGYTTDSYWIRNVRTLRKCTDATNGAAVWATVSGDHNFTATRTPKGADDSYSVGEHWIWQDEDSAWELTSLSGSQQVRLMDFNVSATVRYVIELGDGYARFWNSDGTRFIDELNSPYTEPLQLATPYTSAEIFDVQIAKLGNLAYFAHPSHPPQKLERSFDASFNAATFAWSEVDWDYPAFRDPNTTAVTATPSATTGKPVEISFSADPFTETLNYSKYTGARIALTHRREGSSVSLAATGTGTSSVVSILGEYSVYGYDTISGTLNVEGKDKAGNWQVLHSFGFASDRQLVFTSSVEEVTDIRLDFTVSGGSSTGQFYLEAGDSRRTGYARILNGIPFESSLPVVPVEVEEDFDSTAATTEWAIEAWAEYSGYPRAVCFHEQRLWFGGTDLQPNTVWASQTNDFENFRLGAFDADALAFTLAAEEGSSVQSLLSHDSLVIFTQSEEWTVSTSQQTAITPSNVFVRRQSRYGSAYRQAFIAANNLLFLESGSRKLRQFVYSSSSAAQGQATDLTKYAEHVTIGGIRQMAFQRKPDPVLWAVTENGVLLSFTFEPDENVLGWARHTSGSDTFESVTAIYGDSSDEIWLSVLRGGERMVERLDPSAYATLEAGTATDMIYLDSALFVENDPATATVTGLDHLEGETVSILADGAVSTDKTVSSGSITLDAAASTVVVGKAYTSKLQPSKIEVPMDNGTSQGKTFVCHKVNLNLWKSYGLTYSSDPDQVDEAKWFNVLGRNTDTAFGDPEPLFTGFAEITNQGNHGKSIDFTVRQTLPLPCNVLAMIPQIQISSD